MNFEKAMLKSLVVLLVISFIFILTTSIFLKNPVLNIIDKTPKFTWVGDYDKYIFILDDDESFSNPIVDLELDKEEYQINRELDFGEYYWKVIGVENNYFRQSVTGKFVINSYVGYEKNKNELVNIGNVLSKFSSITGFSILDSGDKLEIEEREYEIEQTE